MAKERKSPQQKKQLEYTKGHFTFGWNSSRMFPKAWKRKKAHTNRKYRRMSEELLSPAKVGMGTNDVELIADGLTAARFQKSVSRKRLRKTGTVTVGEKIKRKLASREEAIGRNVQRQHDRVACSAVSTLSSLDAGELVDVVRRAELVCSGKTNELKRVLSSSDPVDRALHFLYLVVTGSVLEIDALRRTPELDKAFRLWMANARCILKRDKRAGEGKREQKHATQKKLKALRNQ